MLLHDLRFTFRFFRRGPSLTVTLLALLALGLGAVTTMFSVAESLLLRPLPYPSAEELTLIWTKRPVGNHSPSSVADFADWKADASTFVQMAAIDQSGLTLTHEDAVAAHVSAAGVSGDFFPLFGLTAARGRLLGPADDQSSAPPIVVVSMNAWRTHFGADPSLVGQAVSLNGHPYTVVGIAPEGFRFGGAWGSGVDFWIPLAIERPRYDAERSRQHGGYYLHVVGRRRPGVSIEAAQTELDTIAGRLEREHPESNANAHIRLVDLQEELVGPLKKSVWMLFAAVGLVFLTVCANVAGLLLMRGSSRRGEMAARAALGATTGRLVAQLVTETTVLFVLGGLGGVVAASWLIDEIAKLLQIPATTLATIRLDLPVLASCFGIATLSGILFGLVPALAVSRVPAQAVLKETAAGAGLSRRQRLLGGALVATQVALAFVLLAGAGLALRGFAHAATTPSGFTGPGLATAGVSLAGERYTTPAERRAFYRQLLDAIAHHPGVESVAADNILPMTSDEDGFFQIEGHPPFERGGGPYLVRDVVTPGYFGTMGIPLLHGRDFSAGDTADSRPVVIISQSVAAKFFPDVDPIGQRLAWTWDGRAGEVEWREIVGVVGDIRRYGLGSPMPFEGYLPFSQDSRNRMVLAIRSPRAAAVLEELPAIVRRIDASQAVHDRQLMEDRLRASIDDLRYVSIVMGAFAAMSLLLATLGVFGLASYSTSRRTREFGLRMALGSSPERIMGLVVSSSLGLVSIGLATGLVVALALGRVLASRIPEVGGPDTTVFAVIAAILGLTGVAASLVPAYRAVRVPPSVALRAE
jgi:putative ABC transport system permease protein